MRRAVIAVALLVFGANALPGAASAASAGPAWAISPIASSPTIFPLGDSTGQSIYVLQATNVGSKATDGSSITIADVLPPGLSVNPAPSGFLFFAALSESFEFAPCEVGPPVTCTFPSTVVQPGQRLTALIPVNVAPDAPAGVLNRISVSGGGAAAASGVTETAIGPEQAPFGIQTFEASLLDEGGAALTQAGSHPYQMRVGAEFNTALDGTTSPAGSPKDITADLPAGLVVNPRATTVRCTEAKLETDSCPDASAVGVVHTYAGIFGFVNPLTSEPIYNMVPPPGSPASLGFNAVDSGIFIHLLGHVRSDGDYGLSSDTSDMPQYGQISGVSIDLWGDPSDPSHDFRRGKCAFQFAAGQACPTPATHTAFITMPSACSGPLGFSINSDSWQSPGAFISKSVLTEDGVGNEVGVTGCEKLSYSPSVEATPSTGQAESGTGLDFNVDFPNNGLLDKSALAESNTTKVVVTLPEGMTINPSVGEGLGVCTPAQYAKEKTFSAEGEGCPSDSKLGTLHLTTPLVEEGIDGSVYLAQQDNPETSEHGAENPFDTDIALYLVLRNAQLGVMVKRPLKVVPDPKTGQLVATLENIPQLPFAHFNFHFREGARAALVTPSRCGKYTTVAKFFPSSNPGSPKTVESNLEITKGVGGGTCPSGGVPPFHPDFQAGSVNNNAKSYSPFDMRLLRRDGEQDMTGFSAVLPPGVLARLAGVSKCPEASIAAAQMKTGRQEAASPSCPIGSLIGHTLAGAGVGDSLTYVPGQLYLGGAYHGDPLSVVAITPALAGPFDAGTVVVREALTVNPVTAEVEVDGASSDPIPHILKGIVLKLRDLRVYVDRTTFTLNPTSCEPTSTKATLFGAGQNVFDPADDVEAADSARYQAANCVKLGFHPRIALRLEGGTRRGAHPALRAVVRAREDDANIGSAVVTLPHSAFLDQAHIRTICTRVQFAAKSCPAGSVYGRATAYTPLLEEPIEGPVYLRSSNHKLPDLVAALRGIVDVNLVGRIDSFHGGIRGSFESVPDAPVSRFVLEMRGGSKGLVVNSRGLCVKRSKATAVFTGQNGKLNELAPVVKANCEDRGKKHRGQRRRP